ncbi:MAG: efflux RND transporter permease subunit [Elusimicrobia bacterium]|nr:efflux RND transporter permease subunit [Elusimicrobiota bacterium]
MKESFGGLILALLLATVLIYMIMAAGFESLLHPFLIMTTVPLGVVGIAFTMFIFIKPLSVPVFLGMVLLGGIVVCNGIVLIEHINQLREEGLSLPEAVVTGCGHRLRPILMTAFTTILALVPSASGLGQSNALTAPMALATLGGVFFGTMLTLLILPIIYTMVEERKEQSAD